MRTTLGFGLLVSLVAAGRAQAQPDSSLPVRTHLTPRQLQVELSLDAARHLLLLDVTSPRLVVLTPDTASQALAAGTHTLLLDREAAISVGPSDVPPPAHPHYVPCAETETRYTADGEPLRYSSAMCGPPPRSPSDDGAGLPSTIAGGTRRVYVILLQSPLSTDEVLAVLLAARHGASHSDWRARLIEALRSRGPGLRWTEVQVPAR